MDRRLQDRVVVVTGAGSGIGRASAVAFAAAGARVHLVDLEGDAAERAADAIRATGGGAIAHAVDCRDPDAVGRLAETVLAAEGRVDVLHNNAGVVVVGEVRDLPLAAWHHAIDVNLWGVIHGIHAFLPSLIRAGRGHIVNTASMAGLVPFPTTVPYTASKFAVVGLSWALDCELAPHGIRVSALCPGATRTGILDRGTLAVGDQGMGALRQVFQRFAWPPERVAAAAVDAVRKGRGGVIPAGLGVAPLWYLQRASVTLYQGLFRAVAGIALAPRK
jgi:NAD(P)-dependent dehydrogenase (short-subunit alcohol dehydrogenase family)